MKCHTCGADDHLAARCPRSGGGNFMTTTQHTSHAIGDSFLGEILDGLPNSSTNLTFYGIAQPTEEASFLVPTPMQQSVDEQWHETYN